MNKMVCAACAAAAAAGAAFADLPRLDSSEFDYRYDMNSLLPGAEDLDGDGAADFTYASAGNGALTLGTGEDAGSMVLNSTGSGDNAFFMSSADSGAGGAWRRSGIGLDTGYTLEVCLKVSQCAQQDGALALNASVAGSTINGWLRFYADKIKWSNDETNLDATVYHTYRLVRSAGSAVHSVYIDGVLWKDNLGNGFTASGLNRLLIGDAGGYYGGRASVAYMRFHKGAYAPPIPSGKWSGEFVRSYEMSAGDQRFVGSTAGGSDWSGSIGQGAVVVQNGVLLVTAEGTTAWWKANDSVWSADIGPDTAYTVEFKAKVNRRWSGTQANRDLAFQFICGNPRDSAVFYIGASGVYWEPATIGALTALSAEANTNAWHTFRIAYSGASQNGCSFVYTLWRDGEVIGTGLKGSVAYNQYASSGFPNLLRFGVVSSTTVGGSFDIDYLRWTTDGAWDYCDAPKGLIITVR